MTKIHSVRAHVRRSPARPPSYAQTHRALIADARRDPAMRDCLSRRRARAAQARFDAAMAVMAGELTDALEQALRGEEA